MSVSHKVRITADLPLGTIEILRQIAEQRDCSLTEAMRGAIARTGRLHQEIDQGGRLIVERDCGCRSELVLRR